MNTPSCAAAAASMLLAACHSADLGDVMKTPRPSKKVTRVEAIQIAKAYADFQWTPDVRHAYHGTGRHEVAIHTPDAGFRQPGVKPGYWQPGETQRGMPYKWGGFDTTQSFARGLKKGRYAGDVATAEKRQLRDSAVSSNAIGIDCSGFVARCWRLKEPYSTSELYRICDKLRSYDDLRAGDILNLQDEHVLMFSHWMDRGEILYAYEAGSYPEWKVAGNKIQASWLKKEGYLPYRYKNMQEARPADRRPPVELPPALVAAEESPSNGIVANREKGWWLPELVWAIDDFFTGTMNPLEQASREPKENQVRLSTPGRRR